MNFFIKFVDCNRNNRINEGNTNGRLKVAIQKNKIRS